MNCRHKEELLPEADRPYSLFEAASCLQAHQKPWKLPESLALHSAGHICQGLAGAVCFWAAALKAARGTKVSFPCYETWITKSQPFHVSVLLQVADWRLCRICPKDFMWNWTLRVDHIFCPTKVWQNMLPVPQKKVWMKWSQMHRNDITLGLQSRSFFCAELWL